MVDRRYQRTVIAYHGCDAALAANVLAGRTGLKPSSNPYDWLGRGIYFWEHGPQRAYEWATEHARFSGTRIKTPFVLGAKINLGVCLDLLDTANTELLRRWYVEFRHFVRQKGLRMPHNRDARGSRRGDKVLRFRDCAVIDYTLGDLAETEHVKYQTVRGVFLEGKPAFPGSKIALKSHIQIAVKDPACIVKLFRPEQVQHHRKLTR
jgi:hypothetical protein